MGHSGYKGDTQVKLLTGYSGSVVALQIPISVWHYTWVLESAVPTRPKALDSHKGNQKVKLTHTYICIKLSERQADLWG